MHLTMVPFEQSALCDSPQQHTGTMASKHSPPTLDSLPTEILLLIFGKHDPQPEARPASDYLPMSPTSTLGRQDAPLNRQDLLALCLTSRRLRTIAEPLIYENLPLGLGDQDHWITPHRTRRLACFLRTVLERRDLAARIRKIYVHRCVLFDINERFARAVIDQTARRLGVDPLAFLAMCPDLQQVDSLSYPSCTKLLFDEPISVPLAYALVSMLIGILPSLTQYGSEYSRLHPLDCVRLWHPSIITLGITPPAPYDFYPVIHRESVFYNFTAPAKVKHWSSEHST
ncbi:hypothetical protein GGR53DRAFT_496062 [Hypoxylon sp. FL1150]|nr:hypothetical protein GGR53DRAFT_496062 [Hypoxylon sp. FL1150]